MRFTATTMFGSRKGSARLRRRGRRKSSASASLEIPFRCKKRAMQGEPQTPLEKAGCTSSWEARIQRRGRFIPLLVRQEEPPGAERQKERELWHRYRNK